MFFPLALQVHIGCGTEPTMYKGYAALVETVVKHKVPFIGFTTNGQLLTEPHLRTMIESGLTEITLSTHGVTKESYERLMVGASFEKYHANLQMLADLKKRLGVKNPRIRINYTVNATNLAELADFFTRFGHYDIATLQVRPMDDIGNTAYAWEDISSHSEHYNEVVSRIAEQCRERGINLLAGSLDRQPANPFATVYETAVLRVLDPNTTWRSDFDFRAMTYRQYLRSIGYRRQLLKYVVKGDSALVHATRHASSRVIT
jgi:molybdenum cofactor biosynthesis enzyme MoaA